MPKKVWTEVKEECDDRKKLLSGCTIVAFRFGQQSAPISYNPFFSLTVSNCDNTAPMPSLLASVSSMKGLVKSGYTKIGGDDRRFLGRSKHFWHSEVHRNGTALRSVSLCNGLAISAKLLINLR